MNKDNLKSKNEQESAPEKTRKGISRRGFLKGAGMTSGLMLS
jgi:hypothetical protein